MSEDIKYSVANGIATIKLNRPEKYNAVSFEMWDQLNDKFLEIEHDPDIGCVILCAEGKNFSAGTDIGNLNEFAVLTPRERGALFGKRMELTNRIFTTMERIPQPIVSSVRGLALGGGFGLAVGVDLVVASENAQFGIATLNLGSMPDVGVPYQLMWTMGPKKAKQYCLMEERMSVVVAEEFGLVNWVVADDQLEVKTQEVAERLASMPRPAVNWAKHALNAVTTRSLADHLKQEATDVSRCVLEPGYVERVNAFINRK